EMRGRVIALFAVAFLGTTPIGGPIVGWLAEVYGPRASLLVGGAVAVLAVAVAWRALARHDDRSAEVVTLVAPAGELAPQPAAAWRPISGGGAGAAEGPPDPAGAAAVGPPDPAGAGASPRDPEAAAVGRPGPVGAGRPPAGE